MRDNLWFRVTLARGEECILDEEIGTTDLLSAIGAACALAARRGLCTWEETRGGMVRVTSITELPAQHAFFRDNGQ